MHNTRQSAVTQELPIVETMLDLVEADPEGFYTHRQELACQHETVLAANGEGVFCRFCGETLG
jgi:hypothetical protein